MRRKPAPAPPPPPAPPKPPEPQVVAGLAEYAAFRATVRRGLDTLRGRAAPCWQIGVELPGDWWDVEVHRVLTGPDEPGPRFAWAATDTTRLCLDGGSYEYPTPEIAWNAAIAAIVAFTQGQLCFPDHPIPAPEETAEVKWVLSPRIRRGPRRTTVLGAKS
jgi:hypothetical protein